MFNNMAPHQLISFLVLTLCTISVSAQVFLSIDCGSSTSFRDGNLISWTGDDEYINTGESRTVPSSNSVSRAMDTMRLFTTRKKNCYNIGSMRRGRVLIRASFNYGNYDNKSSPPSFDLQYDGNYWATVETTSRGIVNYEVIYVMKGDNISVCIAQTERGHVPFISAIEVRGLDSYMYANIDDNYPLILRKRDAFGSNSSVRYPNDPYDRIWTPSPASNGLLEVTSNAIFTGVTIASGRPPPAVLQNAITAIRPNSSLQLPMGFPPFNITIYINWYFTEVYQLELNETRSFRLFMDGAPLSNETIEPPYGNCTQWYAHGYEVSSSTNITLVPTNVSTLPPLINAMEVFAIGDPLTNGTNKGDVEGLATLQRAFSLLEGWKGDPCLPTPYSWDWIECSNETTPRVTALSLGSFGLSGILPDFRSMDALQTIDLHNNSLQGPIPSFLSTLPDLKELNLANNQFNGSIPASLSRKNGLNLVVTGNPELCTTGASCPNPDSSRNQTRSSAESVMKYTNNLSRLFGTALPSFITIWFFLMVS